MRGRSTVVTVLTSIVVMSFGAGAASALGPREDGGAAEPCAASEASALGAADGEDGSALPQCTHVCADGPLLGEFCSPDQPFLTCGATCAGGSHRGRSCSPSVPDPCPGSVCRVHSCWYTCLPPTPSL